MKKTKIKTNVVPFKRALPPGPSKAIEAAVRKYGVFTGNASTPLQFSTQVHAAGETQYNGGILKSDKLRVYDLAPLLDNGNSFHREVAGMVEDISSRRLIVYVWHMRKTHSVTTYGATITDTQHRVLNRICAPGGAQRYKYDAICYLEAAAGIKSEDNL